MGRVQHGVAIALRTPQAPQCRAGRALLPDSRRASPSQIALEAPAERIGRGSLLDIVGRGMTPTSGSQMHLTALAPALTLKIPNQVSLSAVLIALRTSTLS